MIFFKPTTVGTDECAAFFEAIEDEKLLGRCFLRFNSDTADVYRLEVFTDDGFIPEGLLRSAYNYAANRGLYMGICTAENAEAGIKRMNFETVNGVPGNDIPTLLMGSCCK